MTNRLKWSFAFALIMGVAAVSAQGKPGPAAATATAGNPNSPGDPDDSVYQVGGSIQPPVAIHTPTPKFSKQARAAKFSGVVVVQLIVGTDGKPRDVHVLRGAGMGLDEQALKAVQKYKFKPATKNGKPIAVYLNVEVNFQIIKDRQQDTDTSDL